MLKHVVAVLEDLGIDYAIGGSVASMAYGEPRATRDADIVAALRLGDVPAFLSRFPAPEYYVDGAAIREAILNRSQFNIIHAESGWKVDIYLPADAISRQQVARSRRFETFDGYLANFSPPEELIIKKLEFFSYLGSEKHLRDIAAMLHVTGPGIDRDRVAILAKAHGLLHIWEAVLKQTESESSGGD